jgi:hypothetical protein
MSYLRLHTHNLRNTTSRSNTAPSIQLQLRWRNGAWHFFNVYFWETTAAFEDLEQAEEYIEEKRIAHYSLEGVGVVK